MPSPVSYTAFADDRRIASGTLPDVARDVRRVMDRHAEVRILIFHDADCRQVELDLRGSPDEVAARAAASAADPAAPAPAPASRRPGRPRLGVVAREVTLLPRHWEWLGRQPGGASAVLRRLVEDARRGSGGRERARQSREAVDRFMHVMAGNRPHFEEALRAFYRGEREAFHACIAGWPRDVREHLEHLVAAAWDDHHDLG